MQKRLTVGLIGLAVLALAAVGCQVEPRGSVERVGQVNFITSEMDPVINLGQNGNRIDLDADNDTSLRASADDTVDLESGGEDVYQFGNAALTLHDADASDFDVVFDGNAQDFYICLDDSADDLVVGLGATCGTTPAFSVDENQNITLNEGSVLSPSADATNVQSVFVCENTVANTDTSNKTMCVIPANADILDWVFDVTTAFDGSGADNVDCGTTSGDPDEYVDNIDSSSAGVNRMGDAADMPDAGRGDVGASDITVLCKYTDGASDSSAGAAALIIYYGVD